MILAISRFRVQNGLEAQVKTAFFVRPHLVDTVAGFLGMETYTETGDPSLFYLVTRWTDAASYHGWHKSAAHHRSHGGIPKGLKLDASFTNVVLLERLADGDRPEPLDALVMDAAPMLARYLADSRVFHFLTADLAGTVRACNRAFAVFLGQPAESLIGQSLWPLLPVMDAEVLQQRVREGARERTDRLRLTFSGPPTVCCALDCARAIQPNGFLLVGEVPLTAF
jgi:heme-degrading monooxygenase HmoA